MQQRILEAIARQEELRGYGISVTVTPERVVVLEGEVDRWQQVVDIGHIAGSFPEVKNVLNHITVKGLEIPRPDYTREVAASKEKGTILETDVLIIGAGVSGCAIARALSRR